MGHGEGKGAGLMIDSVYITQHKKNDQTTTCDGENKYLVSTNLLRQQEIQQPRSLWSLNE